MELLPMQTEKPGGAAARREAGGEPDQANWCPESDTMYNVIARRNALIALWAGRKMGLEGGEMSLYAGQVHFSDYQVVGDVDIVGKVCSDLAAHGLEIGEADVRRKLSECHKEALRQSITTD
jgi:hypothetical protein